MQRGILYYPAFLSLQKFAIIIIITSVVEFVRSYFCNERKRNTEESGRIRIGMWLLWLNLDS